MTAPPKIPEQIDDGLLARLGMMVISWSNVESHVAEFLSWLLSADRGSMYVMNQTVAVSQQLQWVRTLSEMRFTHPNTQSNLKILLDRIKTASEDRNAYIHGVWTAGPEPETAMVQTVRLNRSELVRSELVTRADIKDLITEMKDLTTELNKLLRRLGYFDD